MSMLITNARLVSPGIDESGAAIEIENGRIRRLYFAGDALPQNAETYDAAGKTVVPGERGAARRFPHIGEPLVRRALRDEKFAAAVQAKGLSELYIPTLFMYKEEIPLFATGKADNVTLKKWVLEQQ